MHKYNVSVETFNPNRGLVETFIQSVYAADRKDALRQARQVVEKGEKPIVRLAPRVAQRRTAWNPGDGILTDDGILSPE